MSQPLSDTDQPLDPAAAQLVAKIRRLMLISGLTTLLAIAIVVGLIGYRVFSSEGSATTADVTALLPKGARVVSTAVSDDRLVVTIDNNGTVEVRSFDLRTLAPVGRLRFRNEP
jgi:hypothetical protein